jgi:hypothetical protein
MKPNSKWIEDWQIGEAPTREWNVSSELLSLFIDFWDAQALDDKSKTTRNRYSGSLHALGSYLVEQAIADSGLNKTTDELLSKHIGSGDGPLIFHDNEDWQGELDTVCRKLNRHIRKKC